MLIPVEPNASVVVAPEPETVISLSEPPIPSLQVIFNPATSPTALEAFVIATYKSVSLSIEDAGKPTTLTLEPLATFGIVGVLPILLGIAVAKLTTILSALYSLLPSASFSSIIPGTLGTI